MQAIDDCLVVWTTRIFGPHRNDQEGKRAELLVLDQVRVLVESHLFWTTKEQ